MINDNANSDSSAYQSVLNQYSASKKTDSPPPVAPTSEHQSGELTPDDTFPVIPPQVEESPQEDLTKPVEALPPVIQSPAEEPPKKTKNPFKYVFFIALFIFLVISGSIVLSLYQQSQTTDQTLTPTPTLPKSNDTLPPEVGDVCLLNEEQYQVGDSFLATDNCNTCTCLPSLIISCTNIDCQE